MTSEKSEEQIWVALAELFFLDTETDENEFQRVAKLLKASHWDRTRTEQTLIKFIAPHAGANLGFLIYPVIGEWAGFDEERLCEKIRRSISLRENKRAWYFLVSDWWCKKMLNRLEIEKLLQRL